jgi:ribonuclease BN (tRNA processing enzyme)
MSSINLTILGSGTAHPDPTRGPAGLLLRVGGQEWLVDGGSGTLQRCARAGVSPLSLTGGIYSHRHPDHTGDLVPLLFAHRVACRSEPYAIHAGEGFVAFLEGLRGVYGRWIDTPLTVTEHTLLAPSSVDMGGWTLHTAPAVHSAGALHLGFEAGSQRLVFSGDTAPSEALVALADRADLLVVECAGSDDHPVKGHMTPTAIAELVHRARPREVWLTHLYPFVDAEVAIKTVRATGVKTHRPGDGEVWTA